MALEKDLELMDDYLSERMDSNQKATFEERIKKEPALSEEFKIQQSLVNGIKQARIAELKSMLNSIPVTSMPPSQTVLFTKIGGWIIGAGLVATATYFYVTSNESEPVKPVQKEQEKIEPVQETTAVKVTPSQVPAEAPAEKKEIPVITEEPSVKVTDPAVKPSIQAYDPSSEESEAIQKYEQEQLNLISNAFVTSSMEVETNKADKKYNFHYVFKDDKLVLYGAFEKNLYEILEFISENKKTVALYYKTNYYLLDVSKSVPTKLTPIKNKELLRKLQEHRN